MEDLIDTNFGEHDYDWLIAPPETPHVPSSDAAEHQVPPTVSRGISTVRSVSTTRASRVSASQSQNGSTKPARSNSLTHPSILNTYSSFSTNENNKTSVPNTSIVSVTSRPSTPGNRSTTTRPSLTSCPLPARSQTPAKTRSAPNSPGVKTTKSHNSRPSTPTSRPQISSNPNPNVTSSSSRLHSRPSTPSQKPTNPLPSIATGRSTSVGRVRNRPAAATRPSSPSPHARTPVQPCHIPDFPSDAPPNLRTRLPERPVSAGRMRPGAALTTRANLNPQNVVSASSNRRHSLPVVNLSKFPENSPKAQSRSNGHDSVVSLIPKSVVSSAVSNRRHSLPVVSLIKFPENSPKAQSRSNDHDSVESQIPEGVVSEGGVTRINKAGSTTESTGFGRTISKKSLDMALRHMDIKQSIGGIRGTSLFPHSIRSNAPKGRPARMPDHVVLVTNDEVENGCCNGIASPDSNRTVPHNRDSEAEKSPQQKSLVTRESDIDLYGISRYDAMLLKEDSNNMNWLHNIEDKSDQSPVFDHRFEPLPEPFLL